MDCSRRLMVWHCTFNADKYEFDSHREHDYGLVGVTGYYVPNYYSLILNFYYYDTLDFTNRSSLNFYSTLD